MHINTVHAVHSAKGITRRGGQKIQIDCEIELLIMNNLKHVQTLALRFRRHQSRLNLFTPLQLH